MDSYGVSGGEKVQVPADGPGRGAVFHGESDNNGLKGSQKANHGGEGKMSCVFSQGYDLENEEACPSESGYDEQNGAFNELSVVVVVKRFCIRRGR